MPVNSGSASINCSKYDDMTNNYNLNIPAANLLPVTLQTNFKTFLSLV